MKSRITDKKAMDLIQKLMSGQEWNGDTHNAAAEIIRFTGREVKDINEDLDDEPEG